MLLVGTLRLFVCVSSNGGSGCGGLLERAILCCRVFGSCEEGGMSVCVVVVFLLFELVTVIGRVVWMRFGICLRHPARKILEVAKGGIYSVSCVALWLSFGS